jgi:WD40 repeat protein
VAITTAPVELDGRAPALGSTSIDDSPYVGLVPYEPAHTALFFGRERERRIIVANMRSSRLTLLYGASGVGKSSVLGAGVVAYLQEQARDALHKRGTSGFAVAMFNNWRDDPVQGLRRCIDDAMRGLFGTDAVEDPADELDLLEAAQHATARIGGNLLLVLDQFEEYFVYHPHEAGEGTFAQAFPLLIGRPDINVGVLLSIREDALASLDFFKASIPNIFDNYYRIEHLSIAAAKEAIVRPLEEWAKQGKWQMRADADLIDAVLADVRTGQSFFGQTDRHLVDHAPVNSAAQHVEAPFLQLVMKRLWIEEVKDHSHVLRRQTLVGLHGAREIVRTHLDHEMEQLSPDEQEIAARVFYHLVTPSGTKIAHSAADLAIFVESDVRKVRGVLEELAAGDVRILRPVPGDRYEIFHDVLAAAVLDWRGRYMQVKEAEQAQREMEKRIDDIQMEHRLAEQRWRSQLAFTIAAGALVLVVLAGALAWYATGHAAASDAARVDAESQTAAAVEREKNAIEAQNLAMALAEQARGLANQAQQDSTEARAKLKDAGEQLEMAQFAQAAADQQSERLRVGLAAVDQADHSTPHFAAIMRGHQDTVNTAAFSPDAALVVTASEDRTARIWRATDGQQAALLAGHGDAVTSAEFSRDGRRVLTTSDDRIVRLWEPASGGLVRTLSNATGPITTARFTPDSQHVITGSDGHGSQIWDINDGSAADLPGDMENVHEFAFSDDGRRAAGEADNEKGYVWDLATHAQLLRVDGLNGQQAAIALNRDGSRLVAEAGNSAAVWDVDSGTQLYSLEGAQDEITSAVFSPDGSKVAIGSLDTVTRVWASDDGTLVYSLAGHGSSVLALTFSPDSQRLASANDDGTVTVWDLTDGSEEYTLRGHGDRVNSIAFSVNGRQLLTASSDRSARVWEAAPQTPFIELQGHARPVRSASFSGDGHRVVTASSDGFARVWDSTTGAPLLSLDGRSPINAVAIAPDGSRIVTGSSDTTSRVWDAITGGLLAMLTGHAGSITAIDFNSAGDQMATASADGTVRIWDVRGNPAVVRVLVGHTKRVNSVKFTPGGHFVVTSSDDQTARVWDVASGDFIEFKRHQGAVTSGAFNLDGHLVVSASKDGTARIWDAATGTQRMELDGHIQDVTSAIFSPDGQLVVTGGRDGTARVWSVSTGRMLYAPRQFKLAVTQVAVDSASDLIAAASVDGTAVVWERATGRLLADLRGDGSIQTIAFSPDGHSVVTGGLDGTAKIWKLPEP